MSPSLLALIVATAASTSGVEMNKQIVRRVYEECLNKGNVGLLPELIDEAYVGPRGDKGPQAFAALVTSLRQGFPDIKYTLVEIIAEGDHVAVRWRWTGTHLGQFRSYQPTQAKVENDGVAFFELRAGKLFSGWLLTDQLGFLQQIGAVSRDIPGGPPKR